MSQINTIKIYPCFYIISSILVFNCIFLLIKKDLINNNNLFIIIANYILNISLLIFLLYFKNYIFALLISIILLAFSFSLILSLKEKIKKYYLLSFPYFTYTIYIFAYIVNYFVNLDF